MTEDRGQRTEDRGRKDKGTEEQKNCFSVLQFFSFSVFLFSAICFLSSVLIGCGQPLRTLMAVGSEQKQQHKAVRDRDARFNKMLADIRDGRLQEGTRRLPLIDKYGDPVITTYDNKQQVLLYRPQVEFFNATKVYLRFDEDDVLTKITIENEND